ncbi:MAG: DUF1440 domain-containing protein [Actinomycetota bacterium]|nr:DUF1440 domain-containing protein [Actinomycetota bacterium]
MNPADRLPSVLVAGAVSGAAATGLMSVEMLAWQRWAGGGRLAPAVVTERALRLLHLEPSGKATRALVETAAHVAFGAGAGAVYAGLTRTLLRVAPGLARIPPPLRGTAFALGVYATTYGLAIPALGLVPPPHEDVPRRQPRLLAAHVVYGAMLGGLLAARQ